MKGKKKTDRAKSPGQSFLRSSRRVLWNEASLGCCLGSFINSTLVPQHRQNQISPASQSLFAQTGREVGRERNGRRGRTHPTTFSTPLNSFTIRSKHLPVTTLQLFSSHNLADPSWPEWASSF